MKQKHAKYTQINTNKSMHSAKGPVWQNPIHRTVKTAHLCVFQRHTYDTQTYGKHNNILSFIVNFL